MTEAPNYLKANDDGMIQVRDNDGRLMGCIPGELREGTTTIVGKDGRTTFYVGLFMNMAVHVMEGQNPTDLNGFVPNPDYKPVLRTPERPNEQPT